MTFVSLQWYVSHKVIYLKGVYGYGAINNITILWPEFQIDSQTLAHSSSLIIPWFCRVFAKISSQLLPIDDIVYWSY